MRRISRRKKYIQNRIIIAILFYLTFVIALGYSAFSTNINLNTKGSIYKISDKCYTTSDNGDGTVTIIDYDKSCGSVVNIPSTIKGKTVTKIGDSSWNSGKVFNQKSLTKVVIPDTVTYIGVCAFADNKIVYLDLGNGITTIGSEAFLLNRVTNITFPKTLVKIGDSAFLRNNLTTIPSLDNINYGPGAFSSNNLKPEEAFIYSKNIDETIDYTTINSYASNTYIENLNIPSGVKKIVYHSLRHAYAGTITFPEGFEKAEEYSLKQVNATTVNFPSTIQKIGNHAFNQSTSIKTININRKENALEGAPWGATNATINWTGTN